MSLFKKKSTFQNPADHSCYSELHRIETILEVHREHEFQFKHICKLIKQHRNASLDPNNHGLHHLKLYLHAIDSLLSLHHTVQKNNRDADHHLRIAELAINESDNNDIREEFKLLKDKRQATAKMEKDCLELHNAAYEEIADLAKQHNTTVHHLHEHNAADR